MDRTRPNRKIRPTDLAKLLGCSLPYASQLIAGKRPRKVATALRIEEKTGHKFGPIANATDEEVSLLRKFGEVA
jgi:plasmid maintenance system antidote protein VapI